jgi:hypothetical protein
MREEKGVESAFSGSPAVNMVGEMAGLATCPAWGERSSVVTFSMGLACCRSEPLKRDAGHLYMCLSYLLVRVGTVLGFYW